MFQEKKLFEIRLLKALKDAENIMRRLQEEAEITEARDSMSRIESAEMTARENLSQLRKSGALHWKSLQSSSEIILEILEDTLRKSSKQLSIGKQSHSTDSSAFTNRSIAKIL
jgi:hypothetical protein